MQDTYFVNDDSEEYCTLPDPTRPQQVGIVGYLLVQGPMDGTQFTSFPDPDEPEIQEGLESYKSRERRKEGDTFLRYVRERPDYITSQFERSDVEDFHEYCAQKAQSVYRNEDGSWQEYKLVRTVAASFEIGEYFEYLGRWAGDDVRLAMGADAVDGYSNITDDVVREMHQTLPDQFLANGEEVLTPDYVVTASDDDGGGDGDEEATNDDGTGTKLFPME